MSLKLEVHSMMQILCKEIREVGASISKQGIEFKEINSEGFDGHVSAKEFQNGKRPEVFSKSTVIISNGYGVWELEVSEDVGNMLVDMTLKIETIRTHGMLHSSSPNKSASIFVNDQLVDKIYLVKLHPHGKDYGVNSRRPFPIFLYIKIDKGKSKSVQKIKIKVDKDVRWDIDRVTLEPIILRKEIKPEAAMIIGAIISAIIGGIIGGFVSYYFTTFLRGLRISSG
jgi:hypothetical protein